MAPAAKPLLGITMGDPCGIGPEVILRALRRRAVRAAARYVVFGSEAVLRRVARTFRLPEPKWSHLNPGQPAPERGGPFLLETSHCPAGLALLGRATHDGGRACADWIGWAVEYARQGRLDGIVTAPINKKALHLSGCRHPGHTEILAELTGVQKPVMMMVGAGLRVALVTTHAPMAALNYLITQEAVLDTLRVTDRDLRRRFGLAHPRLAVCGLNPHAGESGLFGAEEAGAIAPAIRQAQAEGIACDGPIPGDVAFTPNLLKRHDAVIAMYHDQACIPVKMLAFDSGVNVTLGLPIIRTSPDHGTAYDIVQQGVAHPGSLIAAILLAAEMAKRRSATSED